VSFFFGTKLDWGDLEQLRHTTRWDQKLNWREVVRNIIRMPKLFTKLAYYMLLSWRLSQQVKMLSQGFVQRENLQAGDLVIFRVDPTACGPYASGGLGEGFGRGWGALRRLGVEFSALAGGSVLVMASQGDDIKVSRLGRRERQKLRDTLDAADRGMRQPDFKLAPTQQQAVAEAGHDRDEYGQRKP
jgi:hypothetical protein